jgi:DNA-binding response OmpR family regulator
MTTKQKILLVEDDKNLGIILNEYLRAKGFYTDLAVDGEEGSQLFYQNNYDACILDVMMPKKDGFTLAKEIRSSDQQIPLLFLTAKSLTEDTIEGLKIGADDYITKPFVMEELLARLEAVLRRIRLSDSPNENKKKVFTFGGYTYRPSDFILEFGEEKEKLSPKESKLLHLFLKKQGEMVDRSTALKVAWDDDNYFNSRSMDVYIAKLRKRLKKDASVEILTVHGEGFKLNY